MYKTFICIGIRETLETLTTFGRSGTKLLLPSWHFTIMTVPSKPTTCGASHGPNSPRLAEARKSTCFAQVRISTNSNFSKITPNPLPIASRHDVIQIPSPISYPGFLSWHLWLSHPPRMSVNTCTQCVPLPMH